MADTPGEWTLEWYRKGSAEPLARVFLEGLIGRNKEEAIALITLLRERGHLLRPPQSKQVESGLFELRGHQVRIFYTFRRGRRVVLLDGIIKKQDEIPQRVLDRIRQMAQEVRALDAAERRRGR